MIFHLAEAMEGDKELRFYKAGFKATRGWYHHSVGDEKII